MNMVKTGDNVVALHGQKEECPGHLLRISPSVSTCCFLGVVEDRHPLCLSPFDNTKAIPTFWRLLQPQCSMMFVAFGFALAPWLTHKSHLKMVIFEGIWNLFYFETLRLCFLELPFYLWTSFNVMRAFWSNPRLLGVGVWPWCCRGSCCLRASCVWCPNTVRRRIQETKRFCVDMPCWKSNIIHQISSKNMSVTQLSKDAAWQTRSWTRYVRNGALCFCSNLLGLIIRSAPMPFQLGWTLLEKLMDRCCRLQPPVALKSSRKLAIFSTVRNPDATRSKRGRKHANGWVRGSWAVEWQKSMWAICKGAAMGCKCNIMQPCAASMMMLNSLQLCWDSRAFISRQRRGIFFVPQRVRDVSAILFVTCLQRDRETSIGVCPLIQAATSLCRLHALVSCLTCVQRWWPSRKQRRCRHHLTPVNRSIQAVRWACYASKPDRFGNCCPWQFYQKLGWKLCVTRKSTIQQFQPSNTWCQSFLKCEMSLIATCC